MDIWKLDGTTPVRDYGATLGEGHDVSRLARTVLGSGKVVSTIFIPFHSGAPNPLLFETMVFPSEDSYCDLAVSRCDTFESAMDEHRRFMEAFSQ